jgi:nicotinate dehydrogenase subunit A
MSRLVIRVNGKRHVVKASPNTPLLYVLRNELRLNGPRFGCGLAQCGACTVHLGGKAIRSCVTPAVAAAHKPVTTLEGLGTANKLHPVQKAFVNHQAAQCGYCTSGMIMSAAALLAQKAKPNENEVRAALDGNLCRCGTHTRVIRAVMRASGQGG